MVAFFERFLDFGHASHDFGAAAGEDAFGAMEVAEIVHGHGAEGEPVERVEAPHDVFRVGGQNEA